MTDKLESELERDHRSWAMKLGWFVEKIMQTARNGFPDRFYARARPEDKCPYCGRGRIVLVEWKRRGAKAKPQQELRHKQLREAGVEVYVIDSIYDANKILGLK